MLSSVTSEGLQILSVSCIYRVAVTLVSHGLVEQLLSVRGLAAADCPFAALSAVRVVVLPFVVAALSRGLPLAVAEELFAALPSELVLAVAEELFPGLPSELVLAVLTAAVEEPSLELLSVSLAPAVGPILELQHALAGDTLQDP